MREAKIEVIIEEDMQQVWNVITNNNDYAWRSDLEKIEVGEDGMTFVEYTKSGNQTNFTITKREKTKELGIYEFEMENQFFSGRWSGQLYPLTSNQTKIVFCEQILVKKVVMCILSYLFMNITKIQKQYIADLKRKLQE